MSINKTAPYGAIHISTEAVAMVAGETAMNCYGVVALSPSNTLRESITELLKEDYAKGVYCRKKKDGYEIDIYLILAYGVKVTEVMGEVQKQVAFALEKTFKMPFRRVNVFVQDIKDIQ